MKTVYIVIASRSLADLSNEVNEKINLGYKLQGGINSVFYMHTYVEYTQAMILIEYTDSEKHALNLSKISYP